ncbi:MAG: hypothetical protein A3I66_23735 [Burkholderiales bacterium RIFCSPLOWO2_02_FULL_57_36]|nr:MAG: hypothetical protein A3I66_23735 [Burkholderiales bacterium RIFCSPLOWO2_02_FULL_57_36]
MNDQNDELNKAYDAFEAGDYVRAKELFERLVQKNSRAHLYLGWMYDQGLGVGEDLKQAQYHYQCLSNTNDADGKYYLASLFQKKGDLAHAASLYEESAELDHVSAAYWAYALRSEGSAPLVNKDKADFYLKKAAALGHIFAQRDLARQEMKSGAGISRRTIARFRYFLFKLKGLILILKNSQDMRVR